MKLEIIKPEEFGGTLIGVMDFAELTWGIC